MGQFVVDVTPEGLKHNGQRIVEFKVTGVLAYSTRRFKARHFDGTRRGWTQMLGINLWRGNRWAKLETGRWVRVQSVWN